MQFRTISRNTDRKTKMKKLILIQLCLLVCEPVIFKTMQRHLILYVTELVGYVTALQQPTATRMFLWDHSFPGKRLTTSSLGVIGKTTKQRCVFTCGKIPECLSINFCGSHFCELKREDVGLMTIELFKTHLASVAGLPVRDVRGATSMKQSTLLTHHDDCLLDKDLINISNFKLKQCLLLFV